MPREVQNAAKIEEKNCIKIAMILVPIQEPFFSLLGRFWYQKPVQNAGSWHHFFNIVAHRREVWFWTTLLWFCYIFRCWRRHFCYGKGYIFQLFFECVFRSYFFAFWTKFWCNLGAKRDPKLVKKSMKIYVDFLMKFWWILGRPGRLLWWDARENQPRVILAGPRAR